MYDIKAVGSTISLGRQGENLARQVLFDLHDFTARYGAGQVVLLHQRAGDDGPYPAVTRWDGAQLVWPLTAADTACTGIGRLELQYLVGDVLAKSMLYETRVAPALGEPVDVSAPEQGWVSRMLQAVEAGSAAAAEGAAQAVGSAQAAQTAAAAAAQQAAAAQNAAQAAQTSQTAAQDSAAAAETWAQAAQQSAAAVDTTSFVRYINGKAPVNGGRVTLNAREVGALPSDGTAADSSRLEGMTYYEVAAALTRPAVFGSGAAGEMLAELELPAGADRIQNLQVLGRSAPEQGLEPTPTAPDRMIGVGMYDSVVVVDGAAVSFAEAEGMWMLPDGSCPGILDAEIESFQIVPSDLMLGMFGASAEKQTIYTAAEMMAYTPQAIKTVTQLNEWCRARYAAGTPLAFWYTSDQMFRRANRYVGVFGMGSEYRGWGLPVTAPLLEGDALDTCADSGCDRRVELTGSEDWGFLGADETGCCQFVCDVPASNGDIAVQKSSRFIPAAGGANTFHVSADGVLTVRVPSDETQDAAGWKALLAQYRQQGKPVTVWYRSENYAGGGLPAMLEHRATAFVLLTGSEGFAPYGQENWTADTAIFRATGRAVRDPAGGGWFSHGSWGDALGGDTPCAQVDADGTVYLQLPKVSVGETAQSCANWLQAQLAAGTPAVLTYALATPRVYARDPVRLPIPVEAAGDGCFLASEHGLTVTLCPVQDGGNAATLDGRTAQQLITAAGADETARAAAQAAADTAKAAQAVAEKAMPVTGGKAFSGPVRQLYPNLVAAAAGAYLRSVTVQNSAGTAVQTGNLIMVRK